MELSQLSISLLYNDLNTVSRAVRLRPEEEPGKRKGNNIKTE